MTARALLIIFVIDDDGIVDQEAKRNDKPRYRHLVQRIAKQIEQDQHQRDRQRQGCADDKGRAPAHHDK